MIKNSIYLFILGVCFGSGPCLASCGPALVSYVTGAQKSLLVSLLIYTFFSLGRTLVYFIFIAIIFIFGKPVFERLSAGTIEYLLSAGGAFFILFGAWLIIKQTRSEPNCASQEKQTGHNGFLPAACLGLIFGVLPCTPLVSVLSYIFLLAKNLIQALVYCFSFSIGTFFSALLILVIGAGFFNKLLTKKPQLYRRITGFISGLIFIVIGVNFIMNAVRS
jgi:sulfite exporter TauE/SafE